MKKNVYVNMFYIFLLIHPLLDLITSLYVRFTTFSITPGIIIKGIALLLLLVYVIFFNKSKYKKQSINYIIALAIFILLYLVTRIEILNINNFINEVINLFKYMYLPLMFIGLLNFFDEYPLDNKKIIKIFQINALVFASVILIAVITKTSFSSYVVGDNKGSVGWYYSANEISAILTILFPLMFVMVYENNKWALVFTVPAISGMSLIGTKTAFLGLIIPTILYIVYISFTIFIKKTSGKKKMIFPLILLFLIIFMSPNITAIENSKKNIGKMFSNENGETTDNKNPDINDIVFSSRDIYLKNTNAIYINSPLTNKLFGIGFSPIVGKENKNTDKLIEMDPFDIFYRYGVLGFIVYFIPFIYVAIKFINYFIKLKANISFNLYLISYVCAIALAISILAGHVLGAPSTSIYLAISLVMLFLSLEDEKQLN